MEQCGSHKALQTELWFILLSASRGPWMGCFRGAGILGNLTRCSLSLGLGGVRTQETQALDEGVRRRIQALWGRWPCWSLTDADETVWCNPAGLQMFKGTGSSSEMGDMDSSHTTPCPTRWTNLDPCWGPRFNTAWSLPLSGIVALHPEVI